MSSGFLLTNKALDDMKKIGHYTEHKWGRAQRDSYLLSLDQCFHDLAVAPFRGRDCNTIRLGYRKYQVGKHVIFYRVLEPHYIEIVRVFQTIWSERCA